MLDNRRNHCDKQSAMNATPLSIQIASSIVKPYNRGPRLEDVQIYVLRNGIEISVNVEGVYYRGSRETRIDPADPAEFDIHKATVAETAPRYLFNRWKLPFFPHAKKGDVIELTEEEEREAEEKFLTEREV